MPSFVPLSVTVSLKNLLATPFAFFRFSGGQSPYPAFSPLDIPKVGAEICVAQTVMLTNPDYLSDELPTWENDSADFNPISLLFGDRD